MTALALLAEVACFAVGWPPPGASQARQALGWGGAVLAAGLLLPVAVMLRHLIGSRRGPLLTIAVCLATVSVTLQTLGIAGRLVASDLGAAGGQAATAVEGAVLAAAGAVELRLGQGVFGAAWVWIVAGMMVRSSRFPDWIGRAGVLVAVGLAAGPGVIGRGPLATVAPWALQVWFVTLAGLLLRRPAGPEPEGADAVAARSGQSSS
jgi:hypothetical protein